MTEQRISGQRSLVFLVDYLKNFKITEETLGRFDSLRPLQR